MILAIAIQFTSNDQLTNRLIFIIASATIFQSFNVIDFYFQSRVLSRYIVYANTITLFLSSLVKIALILCEAPLIAFAWVVLFDSFVLACGFSYYFLNTDNKYNSIKQTLEYLTFKRESAVSLLKDSWPLILSGGVLMIQARIDQVMIQELRGSIEVGYYSVAMKLIEALAFMPMLIKSSLFPAIQKAKNHSEKLYVKRLMNYYRLNFLVFLIFAIPIFFFAEKIVVILFGQDYQPAGVLLALCAIRLFFANMGVARSAFILIENLFKFSMITMVIGTIVNIVFNFYLIPYYGAKGAIIATIISFTVTIFVVDIFYSPTRANVYLQAKSMLTFYKINLRS
jgi:O-antigen/teichoic acid export membrane protein